MIGWRNHRSVDIYWYTYLYQFICLRVSGRVVYLELEFYLCVSHGGMTYRGSTCKFRNARNQNCTDLATKYPLFNTKHPVIILQGSLFVVTPAHVASWKNGCQIFSTFIVAENTRSVNITYTTW